MTKRGVSSLRRDSPVDSTGVPKPDLVPTKSGLGVAKRGVISSRRDSPVCGVRWTPPEPRNRTSSRQGRDRWCRRTRKIRYRPGGRRPTRTVGREVPRPGRPGRATGAAAATGARPSERLYEEGRGGSPAEGDRYDRREVFAQSVEAKARPRGRFGHFARAIVGLGLRGLFQPALSKHNATFGR